MGETVKAARLKRKLTQNQLAAMVDVTPRFIMGIENEHKNLSVDVLAKIIDVLQIPANAIFYPETECTSSDKKNLIQLIHTCDGRTLKVVEATLRALLENQ